MEVLIWLAGILVMIDVGVMSWISISMISMKTELAVLANVVQGISGGHKEFIAWLQRIETKANDNAQEISNLKSRIAYIERRGKRHDEED